MSTMNTDNKILNQTNPVYNTAKLTLSILGRAGVPEAIDFAEKLGFTDLRKEFSVDEKFNSDLPHAILNESRYEFLNRVIRETGCKNVVDIACGFSPRGYVLAKEGYNYLGIDLEASVDALNTIAGELKKEDLQGDFNYKACDLTDPDSFEEALDHIDGEVIIVCEGLMPYLKFFEGKSVFEGLKRILSRHGGRFVTPDFMFSEIYVGVHISLLGRIEGMKALMKMANSTGNKSDTAWKDTVVERNGSPRFRAVAEEMGFKVENIPYFTESEEFHVWDVVQEKPAKRVKKALLKMEGWSVTYENAASDVTVSKTGTVKYDGRFDVTDGLLKVEVKGRIDSTTSTELLKSFEGIKADEKFDRIEIDMKELEYISSAGLRVLLIMKKSIDMGQVVCTNVNSTVQEIFDTTGYDQVVTIR